MNFVILLEKAYGFSLDKEDVAEDDIREWVEEVDRLISNAAIVDPLVEATVEDVMRNIRYVNSLIRIQEGKLISQKILMAIDKGIDILSGKVM